MDAWPVYCPDHQVEFDEARVVVIPVPVGEPAVAAGPRAVLTASARLPDYDVETDGLTHRYGVFTDRPVEVAGRTDAWLEAVEQRVSQRMRQKRLCALIGGEALLTLAAVRAVREVFSDVSVLQLAARPRLQPIPIEGPPAVDSVMTALKESCDFVQVGIRRMSRYERHAAHIGNIFLAQDIAGRSDWIDDVVARLSPRVYLTVDMDVFDPAVMPAVLRPEPGGLTWYPVLRLLKRVCQRLEVVGFDVVGLCPDPASAMPDYLVALLMQKILGYCFWGQS